MLANKNLEKPSARIYYNRLLDKTKIDATWDLVKYKVRHLRDRLQKARQLENTPNFNTNEYLRNNIKKQMLDICPLYDKLSKIYTEDNVNNFTFETSTSDNENLEMESDYSDFIKTEVSLSSMSGGFEHFDLYNETSDNHIEKKKRKVGPRRSRDTPIKKWRQDEIIAILEYMQRNRTIEKPTARIYYTKLLDETKIDATWYLVKFKVRYLKTLIEKVKPFVAEESQTDDIYEKNRIKKKILKICPHYEVLFDLFCNENDTTVPTWYYNDDELDGEDNGTETFDYKEIETQIASICENSNDEQHAKDVKKYKHDKSTTRLCTEEILQVLKYLKNNGEVEKPSAKIYYMNLLAATKIDTTWDILFSKVCYLKLTLENARLWLNSIDEDTINETTKINIRNKILQICPYYEKLSAVFYAADFNNINTIVFGTTTFDDVESDTQEEGTTTTTNVFDEDNLFVYETNCTNEDFHEDINEDPLNDTIYQTNVATTTVTKANLKQNLKRSFKSSVMEKLVEAETRRIKLREEKLKLNKEKMLLEVRKLEMREQRLKMEEQRIKNDFYLKKMELEQKERILKYEIDRKYAK